MRIHDISIVGIDISNVYGGYHSSYLIDNSHNYYSWGSNKHNELGTGNTNIIARHLKYNYFEKIAISQNTIIGLDGFGQLYSWGDDIDGKLGRDISNATYQIHEITNEKNNVVTDIASGYNYFMKICDNYVYTWGNGTEYGEVGKFHFIKDTSDINIIPEKVAFYDRHIRASYVFGLKYTAFASSFGEKNYFAWGKNDDNQCYYKNKLKKNTKPFSSYFDIITNISNLNGKSHTVDIWNCINKDNPDEYIYKYIVHFEQYSTDISYSIHRKNNHIFELNKFDKSDKYLKSRKSIDSNHKYLKNDNNLEIKNKHSKNKIKPIFHIKEKGYLLNINYDNITLYYDEDEDEDNNVTQISNDNIKLFTQLEGYDMVEITQNTSQNNDYTNDSYYFNNIFIIVDISQQQIGGLLEDMSFNISCDNLSISYIPLTQLNSVFTNAHCGKDFTIARNALNIYYTWGNNDYKQLLRNKMDNKVIRRIKPNQRSFIYKINASYNSKNLYLFTHNENHSYIYSCGDIKYNNLFRKPYDLYYINRLVNTDDDNVTADFLPTIENTFISDISINNLIQKICLNNTIGVDGNKYKTMVLSNTGHLYTYNDINGIPTCNLYNDLSNTTFLDIVAGKNFYIALDSSNCVWTMGYKNDKGQLGKLSTQLDNNMFPFPPSKLKNYIKDEGTFIRNIYTSQYSNTIFAIVSVSDTNVIDGYVNGIYSWGSNKGNLLLWKKNNSHSETSFLIDTYNYFNNIKIDKIYCGVDFAIAHNKGFSNIYTWGNNTYRQLGRITTEYTFNHTPSALNNIPDISNIFVGPYSFGLVTRNDNNIIIYGKIIMDSNTISRTIVIDTSFDKDKCVFGHTYFNLDIPNLIVEDEEREYILLMKNNIVYRYFYTGIDFSYNQLDLKDDIGNIKNIYTSKSIEIVLYENSQVYYKNIDKNDFLNNNNNTTFQLLSDLSNVHITDISIGENHMIFKDINNSIYTTGSNSFNQLGKSDNNKFEDKLINDNNELFFNFEEDIDISNIVCSRNSSFILSENTTNVYYSFGSNIHGELGYKSKETTFYDNTIRKVKLYYYNGVDDFKAKTIRAGDEFGVAIDLNDNIVTWGDNTTNQLGILNDVNYSYLLNNIGNRYYNTLINTFSDINDTNSNVYIEITYEDIICFEMIDSSNYKVIIKNKFNNINSDIIYIDGFDTHSNYYVITDLKYTEPFFFNVSVHQLSDGNKYFLNGCENPTIYFKINDVIQFDISSNDLEHHPFNISTIEDGRIDNVVNHDYDFTNYVLDNNIITIKIDKNTPTTLWYYCKHHPNMGGILNLDYTTDAPYIYSNHTEIFYTKKEDISYNDEMFTNTSTRLDISNSVYTPTIKIQRHNIIQNPNFYDDVSNVKYISIETGRNFTLALDSSNNIWSWGDNTYGQLGLGSEYNEIKDNNILSRNKKLNIEKTYSTKFLKSKEEYENSGLIQKIKSKHKFLKISTGSYHALAIDFKRNIYSWGYNIFNQLGRKTIQNFDNTPGIIKNELFHNVYDIACLEYSSFAINDGHSYFAWGRNSDGELGSGNNVTDESIYNIRLDYHEYLSDISKIFISQDYYMFTYRNELYGVGNNIKFDSDRNINIPIRISDYNNGDRYFLDGINDYKIDISNILYEKIKYNNNASLNYEYIKIDEDTEFFPPFKTIETTVIGVEEAFDISNHAVGYYINNDNIDRAIYKPKEERNIFFEISHPTNKKGMGIYTEINKPLVSFDYGFVSKSTKIHFLPNFYNVSTYDDLYIDNTKDRIEIIMGYGGFAKNFGNNTYNYYIQSLTTLDHPLYSYNDNYKLSFNNNLIIDMFFQQENTNKYFKSYTNNN